MVCLLSVVDFADASSSLSEISVPDSIFSVELNKEVVQSTVLWQRHPESRWACVKNPSSVRRTTAKSRPQKGTGGARHGSLAAPQFRGGGVVLGPYPVIKKKKLNKKVRKSALKMVLSDLARSKRLILVKNLSMQSPKTSIFAKFIESFPRSKRVFRFYVGDINENVFLSARNIPRVELNSVDAINVYSILNSELIFLDDVALDNIIVKLDV